jgi:uracil phosphoribosyltransferase
VPSVTVITHPLVQQNLSRLRDRETQPEEFRRALREAAALIIYEATRDLETKRIKVNTPLQKCQGQVLKREILLTPVLRAGLGMLESILQIVPNARVGFIGLRREESTLKALPYHSSLPANLSAVDVILIDPMLATGGSSIAAIELLKRHRAKRIRMVNLLAAPEGIKNLHNFYPEVPIFTASIDQKLNHRGYILPGLGDAGDRLFGT